MIVLVTWSTGKIFINPNPVSFNLTTYSGAEHAEGDVVVFLDSHIEALPGWAEPIMDRIARNRKTVRFT